MGRSLEKQKIENELKELEKFRLISEQSLMGIAIFQDGKVLYANPTLTTIIGFSNDEMMSWGPGEFLKNIHKDDTNLVAKHFQEALETPPKSTEFECRAFSKTKELTWVRVFLRQIEFKGKPAIYLTVIDNTKSKKLEQKLLDNEKNSRVNSYLARLLMESMSCIVLLLKPGTREIIMSNQKGIEVGALPGKHCYDTWGQRNDPCPWCLAPKAWKTGKTQHSIVDALDKVWEAYWVPIRKDLYLYYAFDMTDQAKRDQKIEELSKMKSEIIARTSHELKTPLVSIKGFTDLLLYHQKDSLDSQSISLIKEIKDGCSRLEKLIGDILLTSQLDSKIYKLHKTTQNLSDLIKTCIKELTGLIKLRNHKINLKIHEDLVTKFDLERIHEVISNLITNAIKFTPINGEINVKSSIKQNYYYISVKDNGIGFTKEEENNVFTQFGKVEHYGRGLDVIIEGTGLGLYISKRIIEEHEGQIWMKSKGRNKGSTFTFTIPIISV